MQVDMEKSLEEKIKEICDSIKNVDSYTDIESISQKYGLSKSFIRGVAKELLGINLSNKCRMIERAKEIKRLINEGVKNRNEICERAGISRSYLYHLTKRYDIEFPKIKRTKMEEKANRIRKAIEDGARYTSEIAEKSGISSAYVLTLSKRYDIEIPMKAKHTRHGNNLKSGERIQSIDELISNGKSLNVLTKEFGKSKEGLRQYIKRTGQFEEWKSKRRALRLSKKIIMENKKRIYINLASLLRERVYQLAEKEGWAYQKAVEYYLSRKRISHPENYPLGNLIKVFKRYESASLQNYKVSLESIGGMLDMYPAGVGKVLKTVGLEPMYGTLNRHVTPKKKKEAIRRGFNLGMSPNDIGYLLKLPDYVVSQIWDKIGKRPRPSPIKILGREKKTHLTYKLASQIYEAKDLKFRKDEIMELFDINHEKVVDYTLENRETIEPKIIESLRVLYNNKRICRPYIMEHYKLR